MKKKLLIIVSVLVVLFCVGKCNAKALTMGMPDSCADNANGGTVCGSSSLTNWNDTAVYEGYRYLGSTGSTAPIYSNVNLIWPNADLCGNGDITISGQIWGLNQLFAQNYGLNFWNGGRQLNCTFTRMNNSRQSFTCTGHGGGDLIMNFTLNSFATGRNHAVGVSRELDIICDANNNDIVNSVNAVVNVAGQVNQSVNVMNESVNLVNESVNRTNDSVNRVNGTLTDTNTSGAESDAESFFDDFDTEDQGGLSSIITAPLSLIESLDSSTCTPLSLTIPFVNQTLTLPCMTPIYQEYFGTFLTIYQSVITGFVAYWVCIKIYSLIKSFKDPEDDKIEVIDL